MQNTFKFQIVIMYVITSGKLLLILLHVMYVRTSKRERFIIVPQTVLQYFVLKLQCVLHKITNRTTLNYKSTNPSTNLNCTSGIDVQVDVHAIDS